MSAAAAPKLLDYQPLGIEGKSIVVTGGTTGIGRATALLLGARGARVLTFGRHEKELEEALGDMRSAGAPVEGLTADAASFEDLKRVFEEADRRIGGVEILVNNAALPAQSILDSDYDCWEYVVRTNLLGYMACCRLALDRMIPRGQGHIVNIGSMSADVRETGSDLYVATKSGLQGFSESLRKKVNQQGVKVSLIEPGSVGSDMVPGTSEEHREKAEALEQLKAEDIAECVHYCLTQPQRCDVVSVQIRPHLQAI